MEVMLYGALVVVLLAVIYRLGKKKDGFVAHWSRSLFMRELNEKRQDAKAGDIKTGRGA